jgi:hypothetical protein
MGPSAAFLQAGEQPKGLSVAFLQGETRPLSLSVAFPHIKDRPKGFSVAFRRGGERPKGPLAAFLRAAEQPKGLSEAFRHGGVEKSGTCFSPQAPRDDWFCPRRGVRTDRSVGSDRSDLPLSQRGRGDFQTKPRPRLAQVPRDESRGNDTAARPWVSCLFYRRKPFGLCRVDTRGFELCPKPLGLMVVDHAGRNKIGNHILTARFNARGGGEKVVVSPPGSAPRVSNAQQHLQNRPIGAITGARHSDKTPQHNNRSTKGENDGNQKDSSNSRSNGNARHGLRKRIAR